MTWDEIVIAWFTEIKGYKVVEGRGLELIRGALHLYANYSHGQIERVFEDEHGLLGTYYRPILINPGIPSLESIFEEIKRRNLSVAIGATKSGDWGISIYREPNNEEYGQELRGWDPAELNKVLAEALILFIRRFKKV